MLKSNTFRGRFWSDKRISPGFSLLELVVVLVILGVVAAFAARPVAQTMEVWLGTMRGQTDRAEVNYALERVAREVRQGDTSSCGSDIGDIGITCSNNGLYTITATRDDYSVTTDVYPRFAP